MGYLIISANNKIADIETQLNENGLIGYKVAIALSIIMTVELLLYQEDAMEQFEYRVRRVFNSVDDIQTELNTQAADSFYLIQSWMNCDYITLVFFRSIT